LPVADPIADDTRHAERLMAAMRDAGALALAKFRSPIKSWTKGHSSPVCEADIAVNDLLKDRLDTAAEGFGWLSEETLDDPKRMQARRLWIVDPIDGTRAYLAGLTDWSISVALVENGRPILGAVFAPVADEMFFAIAGKGATLNGAPIHTTDGKRDGSRIAAPPGYLKRLRAIDASFVALPKVHSLALRFARVAQGQIDAAFASRDSHDWDLAAADLLVHEAGGDLTTFTGHLLIYNRADPVHAPLVAAGHDRHATLVDLLRNRRIDDA
jgi:myo-inositol-1(or 4)-monophosphatase